jgi:hypothetical protein
MISTKDVISTNVDVSLIATLGLMAFMCGLGKEGERVEYTKAHKGERGKSKEKEYKRKFR